jgi:2-(1,2-epoxy-1,2-dihydrophenyl)acetyl-CoA isomerase
MNVEYQLQDDIALITLNRPRRYNALNADVSEGLVEAFAKAGAESRAAILTGAGKAFCSGADLDILKDDNDEGTPHLEQLLEDVFHPALDALVNSDVPTVGAINGVAAGAGLGLALAADIRIFGLSGSLTSAFTAIGLAPDSGTTWSLPHHVGVSKALELAMTNRVVDSEEAKDLGLAAEVVADEDLLDRALELANQFADMSTDSLVTTRRLMRGSGNLSFDQALAAEKVEQGRLGRTAEHREGVMAFLEKRSADFRNP